MPLLKCQSSKSTPQKVMAYVTDKNKAEFVSVRNLFEDEDYAKQFEETAKRFGKGEKFEERKYYHFKLSCDRKDKVSPQEAHIYAEELTAILFRDCECVIATHTDTDTVHSHIVVNAVHPDTGKKLRITRKDYTDMKDEAIKRSNTAHVETLVVLSHKKPDSHLEVKIDFDNTSLDKMAISERAETRKPQEKTTYKNM